MEYNKSNFVGFDLTLKEKKLFDCHSGQVVAIICQGESQTIVKEEPNNPLMAVIIGKLFFTNEEGRERVISTGIKKAELFYRKDFENCYVDTDLAKLDTNVVKYKYGHLLTIQDPRPFRDAFVIDVEVIGILINLYNGKLTIEYRLEAGDNYLIATQDELDNLLIQK